MDERGENQGAPSARSADDALRTVIGRNTAIKEDYTQRLINGEFDPPRAAKKHSKEWHRGYQAALDDMRDRRGGVGSPCPVCGEPIPPSKGGGARLQCSRECTVAASRARARERARERPAKGYESRLERYVPAPGGK